MKARGYEETGGVTPTAADTPLLHSVEEAAAMLGIGRTFMFRLVGTGEIESCKIGKLRKISSAAIQDYIARLTREQATAPTTQQRPQTLR